jgi:lipoyl(octanoyl) transferase
MDRFFLLDDDPAPGALNMAKDEFLLERAGRNAPVLRIYSFEPAAITLGYHQDPEEVLDIEALKSSGLDLVRRITGGRALLHDGELTYCIASPNGSGHFGSGLADAYMRISQTLCAALKSIGVEAEVSRGRGPGKAQGLSPPCLVSVSRHELLVKGRKIAGSAQRRTALGFIQHGSILLRPGSGKITSCIRGRWGPLEDRITSVSEELGAGIDRDLLKSSIMNAFAAGFGIEWEPLVLTPLDREDIGLRADCKRREFDHLLAREAVG